VGTDQSRSAAHHTNGCSQGQLTVGEADSQGVSRPIRSLDMSSNVIASAEPPRPSSNSYSDSLVLAPHQIPGYSQHRIGLLVRLTLAPKHTSLVWLYGTALSLTFLRG
jgi:hypothetical protein